MNFFIHLLHKLLKMCLSRNLKTDRWPGMARGRFKNTYELLNLRALKFSPVNKTQLLMYGKDILRGISKGTFEIPHKISYPYIERYDYYTTLTF